MWQMGARTVVITNAAGGLNPDWAPGDLMLIRDHLNMTGMSPLAGHNDDRFGPRFPDMTSAWTPELADIARVAAAEAGLTLREGVYVGVLGPAYETPAEVQLFARFGGGAVGMSTVPEAIVARHMGMRILGISTITNLGAGISGDALDHSEVQEVATAMRGRFMDLLDRIVGHMAKQGLL
jgi:purine-nucleoside phosphorylase